MSSKIISRKHPSQFTDRLWFSFDVPDVNIQVQLRAYEPAFNGYNGCCVVSSMQSILLDAINGQSADCRHGNMC